MLIFTITNCHLNIHFQNEIIKLVLQNLSLAPFAKSKVSLKRLKQPKPRYGPSLFSLMCSLYLKDLSFNFILLLFDRPSYAEKMDSSEELSTGIWHARSRFNSNSFQQCLTCSSLLKFFLIG